MNLYDSLFNGTKAPLSAKLQAEEDREWEKGMERVMKMTEEEKIAEFNRLMGRDK